MIKWSHPGHASVLVGGAFGSEGKGQIAAWLALETLKYGFQFDWTTTNAGAQAGHTTRFRELPALDRPLVPQEFICYHLPTAGVIHTNSKIYLNGGSIIDPKQLEEEIDTIGVDRGRITVHPTATVITDADREAENAKGSSTQKIASTMKGVGSALSRKIMRRAEVAGLIPMGIVSTTKVNLNEQLTRFKSVMVEIPQGFGLSINHGHMYPAVTSRDCWVASGISDAGIHPSFVKNVCMVVRTRPIRVGHVTNEKGERLGDSGPFYPGSYELDWARDLPSVQPERTTVTKRIRRIATWSDDQYYEALTYNRPTVVALTFCDYLASVNEFRAHVARMRAMEERAGLRGTDTGGPIPHIYSMGNCVEDVTTATEEVEAWLERKA